MLMKNRGLFITMFLMLSAIVFSDISSAQEDVDVVIYSGYFSREQNDGDMAEMSGKSHYVKFYRDNRFIRLYIPYPYSKTVTPEAIREVFQVVNKQSAGSAYIKDTFGVLDEKIIAHIDVFRRIDGEIMFDCGFSAPCKIVFDKDVFKVLKKGIVKDHVTQYNYVSE